MGTFSCRKDSHPTSCDRNHLKPPSYCYYGWFTCPEFPPSFRPGSFLNLPLRVFWSRNPILSAGLFATFSCGIYCAQTLWECCHPFGFLLSPRNKQRCLLSLTWKSKYTLLFWEKSRFSSVNFEHLTNLGYQHFVNNSIMPITLWNRISLHNYQEEWKRY